MIVQCSGCGNSIEENELISNGTWVSCPKCGGLVQLPTSTQPFEDPAVEATMASRSGVAGVLAENKRYAVVVLEGKKTGDVIPLSKPSVTIGRIQCDINIDDTEVSRQHALITIRGTEATLDDLGSTNGIYVGDQRVQHAGLVNSSEFRIGNHLLMFVVTDKVGDLP
jgi:hypothetical protein